MCPIAFNICGMKLKKDIFLDSPLNNVVLCKYGKILSDVHISRFTLTFVYSHFAVKCKDVNYKRQWNILVF